MSKRWIAVYGAAITMLMPGLAEAHSISASPPMNLSSLAKEAGILPTSPLYGVKRLGESLELFFIFSASGKAHFYLYLAKVRAAEAAAMVVDHQPKLAATAFIQYASDLAQAEQQVPTVLTGSSTPGAGTGVVKTLVSDAQIGHTLLSLVKPTASMVATVDKVVNLAQQQALVANGFSGKGTLMATASTSSSNASAAGVTGTNQQFLASLLASAAHTSVSHVNLLYTQLQSWGQVAKHLDVSLGEVLGVLGGSSTRDSSQGGAPPSISSGSGLSNAPTGTNTPTAPAGNGGPANGTVPSSTPGVSNSASTDHSSKSSPDSQSSQKPPEAPQVESLSGTVTAASLTSITVAGKTFPVASGVSVHYQDKTIAMGQVVIGAVVKLGFQGGVVTAIQVSTDPGLPPGNSVTGQITAVTPTSITVGGYVLTLGSSLNVKFHDFQLTQAALVAGEMAKVQLNSNGHVNQVKLETDPNLPSSSSYQGPVRGVSPSSITVGAYTFPVSGVNQVSYGDFQLPYSALAAGVTVKVSLNQAAAVSKIKITADPALPNSQTVQGAIQSVSATTIGVDGYTLTLASPVVQFGGQTYTGTLQPGWVVKLKLNQQAQVSQIDIQSGPPTTQSGN